MTSLESKTPRQLFLYVDISIFHIGSCLLEFPVPVIFDKINEFKRWLTRNFPLPYSFNNHLITHPESVSI